MQKSLKIFLCVAVFLFAGAMSWQVIAAGQSEQAQSETITGQITEDGVLMTDEGQEFQLSGDFAEELKQMPGQRVEIMGTVMEQEGQSSVEVQDYQLSDDVGTGTGPMPDKEAAE